MIKKIYKFNWLFFLIFILIAPLVLIFISMSFIAIWNNLEIKISNNWEVYNVSKLNILLFNIFLLLVSIILLFSIFFYFIYDFDLKVFIGKSIEINKKCLSKRLLKKLKNKLFTTKNYQKWLLKYHFEYKEINNNY